MYFVLYILCCFVVVFLQSNEVKGLFYMEFVGLKRVMVFLKDYVNIKILVIDCYFMVKKYMKDCYVEKNYYFDVWYIVKGNLS